MAAMMNEKWQIAFKLVDFNKDGVITVKDRDDCLQSFLTILKPDGERKQEMEIKINEFWDRIVFLTNVPDWSKSFTHDEFLASRKEAYTKDAAETVSVVHQALRQLISAGDVDKYGKFTYEQFKTLYEAFNLKEEKFVKCIYSIIGSDSDGRCSVDNIAGFYTELAMGNETGKHEQYVAALESAGFV